MGAFIGYTLLAVIVFAICALVIVGTVWLLKRFILEIKLIDNVTTDEVKAKAAEILSTRTRNRGW